MLKLSKREPNIKALQSIFTIENSANEYVNFLTCVVNHYYLEFMFDHVQRNYFYNNS